MLTALQHLGSVGVGVTSPQFFRADDGNMYVVKLHNNRLGIKVLINEYLGAEIGKILQLCFPASDVIELNANTVYPAVPVQLVSGRHYASRYIAGSQYIGSCNLRRVDNIAAMAGVILFDHIFHNADRTYNKKNLILKRQSRGFRIYAIDNSHLFGSGRWTVGSLQALANQIKLYSRNTFGLLLKYYLSVQDSYPYLDRLCRLSEAELTAIIGQIPAEWPLTPEEQAAIQAYVRQRCAMGERIFHQIRKRMTVNEGR